MPDRFHCADPPVDGRLTLVGDEARHLAVVLRAAPGRLVETFDGRGRGYRAVVVEVGRHRVALEVQGVVPDRLPACRLTLGTALPKGERLDWLVEKATELGVFRLVPLRTARSVVDPRGAKLERLRRTVLEASKQSGRNTLMEIAEPAELSTYLASTRASARWFAHPSGAPAAAAPPPSGPEASLAIGPEGGFTDAEAEAARDAGWVLVGLGATTLRVETAALAASTLLLGRAGD